MIAPRILPTMPAPSQAQLAAFTPLSEQRLQGVNPQLAELLRRTEEIANQQGINVQVTEGMRTQEQQRQNVARGASQTMNSRHLTGNAVDLHVLNPDGSVNWDVAAYRPIADIAKGVASEMGISDFVWGGDWKSLVDAVHFQAGGQSGGGQRPSGLLASGGGNTAVMGQQGNDTMAQTPQQPQDNSIWRNVPFLADADRRARLQIGLEGMTLNPNQALIQGAQGSIDNRAEAAKLNQTAEWLNAQPGGQQFAQALMSGIPADQVFGAYMQSLQPQSGPDPIEINGQLVNPTTGTVIGDFRTPQPPDPGYRPLTPDEVAAFPGLDQTKAYQVSPDGEIKPIGGAGGVNVNVGAGETAFDKATGEALASEAKNVVEQGAIAQRNLGTLGSLEAALANAPQGAVGALANMAGSLGIKTEGSSDLEVANALISQLVPQQRTPGSGQMSDRDVQLFKESLPRLINTPEGNQKIIQTMRAVAEYDVARGEIARKLQLRQITPTEADTAYRALGNPLAEYAQGVPQGTTAPATSASAVAPPPPAGSNISQADWDNAWQAMSPEERALFQ